MERRLVPAALLTALLLWAHPGAAAEYAGIGGGLGVGVSGYSPAPSTNAYVLLPALEIAANPRFGSRVLDQAQLRFRIPVFQAIYAAAGRQLLDLQLDTFGLIYLGKQGGKARFPLGPMIGLRLQARRGIAQPGLLIGGRAGVELLDRTGRTGVQIALEPSVQVSGGLSGAGRRSTTVGGALVLTVTVLRYRDGRAGRTFRKPPAEQPKEHQPHLDPSPDSHHP